MNIAHPKTVAQRMKTLALLATAFVVFTGVVAAQKAEVIHKFPASTRVDGLFASEDGQLFGTLANWTQKQSGAVFKLGEKDEIVEVANFSDAPMGASHPTGTLIMDGSWLWGVTAHGGETQGGAVFRVHSFTGKLEIIAAIPGTGSSGGYITEVGDNSRPTGTLSKDKEGFIVGDTASSKVGFPSRRFRVNPKTGEFTIVCDLKPGFAPLVLLPDGLGASWGIGPREGKNGAGAIQKVAPTGEVSTEVQFTQNEREVKGRYPKGMTLDNRGILWGVTLSGGAGGNGTIFSLNPKAGEFRTVFEFGRNEGVGFSPNFALIKDRAGTLWGTTSGGGFLNSGTLFKLDPATGEVTTMIEFGKNPDIPQARVLFLHKDGNLYGQGGLNGNMVFRIRLHEWKQASGDTPRERLEHLPKTISDFQAATSGHTRKAARAAPFRLHELATCLRNTVPAPFHMEPASRRGRRCRN